MTRSFYRLLFVAFLLAGSPLSAEPITQEGLPSAAVTPASKTPHDVLDDYLKWFFQHTNGKQLKEARQYVSAVVAAAQVESLDPLLLAITISHESTWRTRAVGSVGETGLMQVHGGAARGFDVATVEGNLAAGARWLATRIQKYGLAGGIVAYMGASERARRAGKWRLDAYLKECARQGLQPQA